MRFIIKGQDVERNIINSTVEFTTAEANFLLNFAIEALIQTGAIAFDVQNAVEGQVIDAEVKEIYPTEQEIQEGVDPELYGENAPAMKLN